MPCDFSEVKFQCRTCHLNTLKSFGTSFHKLKNVTSVLMVVYIVVVNIYHCCSKPCYIQIIKWSRKGPITMPSKLHFSTAENLIPFHAVVNQPLQEERFINPLSTLDWSLPNSQTLVSCAERGSTPTSILFEHRAMQLVPPGRHQGAQHVLSLNLHFGLAKCQNQ
jgi:hypothetical protein